MRDTGSKVSLTALINSALDAALSDLHTHLPGRVESYDPATGLASVVPLLKRKYAADDAAIELPVIPGVPVMHPRAGNAWVKLPIAAGDMVLLEFSERSLDRWLEKGGVVDPEDPAKFSLNDAVAYPGLYPKPSALAQKGATTSLEIVNGNTVIEITAGGTVKITATKVVVTSSDINLGDESGGALVKVSDIANGLVLSAASGSPVTWVPAVPHGTLKVKGS
jgi:hypothetical protein